MTNQSKSQCEPFKEEILERVLRNGEQPSKVARSLNLNTQATLLYVKQYGWKRKTDTVNSTYFSTIDTHTKAYLLGFLMGDSCLVESKGGYTLTTTIHEKDRHILEILADELGFKNRRPYKPYPNLEGPRGHQVRFTVTNVQLSQDLMKLGMSPRKSLTLGDFITPLPEEFRSSAILGLYDADGSFTVSKQLNKNGNPMRQYIQIRCTEAVANGIISHIELSSYCLQKHDAIPSLCIGNRDLIFKFYSMCYKDSPIWLPRKRVKMEELLNKVRTISSPISI